MQAAKASDAKVTWDLLQSEIGGGEHEEEEGGGEDKMTPSQVYRKAAGLMLAGAALVGFFADPLVDSIGSFSAASNIPPFFVAFVVRCLGLERNRVLGGTLRPVLRGAFLLDWPRFERLFPE